MLPSFARHRRHHSLGIAVVVGGTCLMLSGLFVLHAPEPTVFESVFFVAAVCGGICYAAARDTTSYWIYAALVPKFYLAGGGAVAAADDLMKAASMVTARAPLVRRAVTMGLAAALLFLAIDAWSEFSRPASIIATTVIVYPSMLVVGLHRAAPLYIAVAGLSPSARRKAIEPRSVLSFLIEDTWVALSINLAIVSPLAHRETFATTAFYADPNVLLKHLSLMLLITTTMAVGARRSRLPSTAGEVLSGMVCALDPAFAWPVPMTASRRLLLGCGVVATWVLLSAASFHGLRITPGFLPLYLLLLIPVVIFYVWERGLTLRNDVTRAFELLDHLKASGVRPELPEAQP